MTQHIGNIAIVGKMKVVLTRGMGQLRSYHSQIESGTDTSTTAVRVNYYQYNFKLARAERDVTTFHPPMHYPWSRTRPGLPTPQGALITGG